MKNSRMNTVLFPFDFVSGTGKSNLFNFILVFVHNMKY